MHLALSTTVKAAVFVALIVGQVALWQWADAHDSIRRYATILWFVIVGVLVGVPVGRRIWAAHRGRTAQGSAN